MTFSAYGVHKLFFVKFIFCGIVLVSLLSSAQSAIENYGITPDSVNLSARSFFESFMSKDDVDRQNARIYLLGVMDTTEGKSWCRYQDFKSITLRETIFSEFKKLNETQLNERASTVIEDVLRKRYPCGSVK